MKKILSVTAALMLILNVIAFAQTVGVVNCDVLNFRSQPNTSSSIIGQLCRGNTVNIIENAGNGWSKVTYNNKTGYVATQYLDIRTSNLTSRSAPILEASVNNALGYINEGPVNFRVQPNLQADIICTLGVNTKVTVCEDLQNGWYKIFCGKYGYVASQYITIEGAPVSSRGQQVVEYAKQFIGVPYVYGGNSPSGFDCSGFAKYVYSNFGVEIPRVADDQSAAGDFVPRDRLMPGDLVCFNNGRSRGVNHVGIYVGDGNMIHSPKPGDTVRIETIASGYYNDCYYNARRFVY